MKKIILMVVTLSALSCTGVFAQQEKGDLAVTFSGTFTAYKGFSYGQIFGKVGYFVTKNVEVGAKPQILLGKGFSGGGLGVYGTYNFLTADAKLVPYAGMELSFLTIKAGGESSLSQTNLGLYGGSKYFVTERMNIDAGMNLSFNIANNSDVNLGTIFTFQVGIGFILGKLTSVN